ncbi:uncharacterized protein LOC143289889 isoform X2 [Babylonia areolata]|uniref:uncharacterized protein LOC143289889 isoform X2 n=1 Tax=Babylonia areolata TaxID=304850 RepID=UPI003FD1767C
MDKVVCAFCGHGRGVEQYCGILHCHQNVLFAHHKCMYSSGLTQYVLDQFGGFDPADVQSEIKRGRKLVCSWCKTSRTKEGQMTSATAGCMLSRCHKSFHFLCAKLHAMTSRRRMKMKKGTEVDLYRVFCSMGHKMKYQKSEKGQQEYSCSETDEEFDVVMSSQFSRKQTGSESCGGVQKGAIQTELDCDDDASDAEDGGMADTDSECAVKKESSEGVTLSDCRDCTVVLHSLDPSRRQSASSRTGGRQQRTSHIKVEESWKLNEEPVFRSSNGNVFSSQSSCHSGKPKFRRKSSAVRDDFGEKRIKERPLKKKGRKRLLSQSDQVDSAGSSELEGLSQLLTNTNRLKSGSFLETKTIYSSDSSDFDLLPLNRSKSSSSFRKKPCRRLPPHTRVHSTSVMSPSHSQMASQSKVFQPQREVSRDTTADSPAGHAGGTLSGADLLSDNTQHIQSVQEMLSQMNDSAQSSELEEIDLPVLSTPFDKSKKRVSEKMAAIKDSKPVTAGNRLFQKVEEKKSKKLHRQYSYESTTLTVKNVTDSRSCSSWWTNSTQEKLDGADFTQTSTPGFQKSAVEIAYTVSLSPEETIAVNKNCNPAHLPSGDKQHEDSANPNQQPQEMTTMAQQRGDRGVKHVQQIHLTTLDSEPQTGAPQLYVDEVKKESAMDVVAVESQSTGLKEKGEKSSRHQGWCSGQDALPRGTTNLRSTSLSADCVLVIPADARRFECMAFDVQRQVGMEVGVGEGEVYLWTVLTPLLLPPSCMLYFFSDIVTALRNEDWNCLRELLMDVKTLREKFDDEYSPRMRQRKNLGSAEEKQQEIDRLVKSIMDGLCDARDRLGSFVGIFTHCCSVNYLLLHINHTNDQQQILRRRLHARMAVYQWRGTESFLTSSDGVPGTMLLACRLHEAAILRRWFTVNVGQVLKVVVLPEEEVLLNGRPACGDSPCLAQLKAWLEEAEVSSSPPPHTSHSDLPVMLFIRRMDPDIVSFQHYLQACLKKYCRDFEGRRLICVFHVDNLNVKRCPQIDVGPHECCVKLYTAFKPSEKRVSLVIADVERHPA